MHDALKETVNMFNVTIDINGSKIINIYGHNEGSVEPYPSKNEACNYKYEIYEIGRGKVINGKLVHNRKDGMLKLISAILKDAGVG